MNRTAKNKQRSEQEQRFEFCRLAAEKLGYTGDNPVGFWVGSLFLYLQKERKENKHVRLDIPLTAYSPDFQEVSAEFCRHLGEKGDAGYRYET